MAVEQEIKVIEDSFKERVSVLASQPNPKLVEELRIEYLGRKGSITGLMSLLKTATPEEKPLVGKLVNELRGFAENALDELKKNAALFSVSEQVKNKNIDISLPVSGDNAGALHPVSLMKKELIETFHRMGFTFYEGPEVDLDF